MFYDVCRSAVFVVVHRQMRIEVYYVLSICSSVQTNRCLYITIDTWYSVMIELCFSMLKRQKTLYYKEYLCIQEYINKTSGKVGYNVV